MGAGQLKNHPSESAKELEDEFSWQLLFYR
jgi:hypothetical protein